MNASSPEPLLQFHTPFQLIPSSRHEVVLYGGEAYCFNVRSTEFDVVRLCENLNAGISAADLFALVSGSTAAQQLMDEMRDAQLVRNVQVPDGLEPELLERWSPQVEALRCRENSRSSRFDMMKRLRGSHVLAIGVGSLGSWAIQHLVAAGVGKVTLVDFDVVSASNLTRQCFFREKDVGRPKLEAAREVIETLSRYTRVETRHLCVDSAECARTLIDSTKPVDLVVLTADEPMWKIAPWLAQAALRTNVPLLRGNSRGIGPLLLDAESACPACDWPRICATVPHAAEVIDYYRSAGVARRRAGRGAVSTQVAIAGALLGSEALAFLAGVDAPISLNTLIRVSDGALPQVHTEPFPKSADCPICGPTPNLNGLG